LLPLGTAGIKIMMESPDLADGEQAWVALSISLVTARATTIRTLGRVAILTDNGKNMTNSTLCRVI